MPPNTTWRQLRELAERRERLRTVGGIAAVCVLAAVLGLFIGATGVAFPWSPAEPVKRGLCPWGCVSP